MVDWLADVGRGTYIDPFAGLGQHLPKFVTPGRRVIGYEIEQPDVDVGNAEIGAQIRAGKVRDAGKPWWPIGQLLHQGDSTHLPPPGQVGRSDLHEPVLRQPVRRSSSGERTVLEMQRLGQARHRRARRGSDGRIHRTMPDVRRHRPAEPHPGAATPTTSAP